MKPRSGTLFHFTKSIDILKNILKNGFYPRYCLEDITWHEYRDSMEYIAFPMICFCDIPIARINEHIDFYGKYGIGVVKEWGVKNELNPVMYFAKNNQLRKSFNYQHLIIDEIVDTTDKDKAMRNFRHTLSFVKPIQGKMIVKGKPEVKEFYQESEWRYVPFDQNVVQYLKHDSYDIKEVLDINNQIMSENYCKKIEPKDIRYIFVEKDSDIPEVVNFIQTELDHFSASEVKILLSRITSLDSIQNDV